MKLDNNLINEIKNSVDIVDVVSNYVKLTSKGKNYFGVCPFHDDHSPSMSVSKEKQIYTCFSCGATGNVFKFIGDYENISFIEAVKKVADIGGISIDINTSYKKQDKNQELYDIYNLSQKFYTNNINTKEGAKAIEYLHNREINDDIIKEFGIGLSLNKKDMLTNILKKKFDEKKLVLSGLITEKDLELSDIYRNRIMFPLYDLNGRIVGYNGRVYNGEKDNKYINSKETPIFKKGELLYNYHKAREEARKSKCIIIMEGQLDVIRAYSIGIKNVVATLGTAFTKEQALLVRKLSNNVILCFDGDSAGLKATKSSIEELKHVGIEPKIIRLPNNMDPDEYIIKNGKEGFLRQIKDALNIMEFKELELKGEYNLNNTKELADYINKMISEINNIDDDILREVSINKLANDTNLDIEIIKSKIVKNDTKIEFKPKIIKMNKYEKSQSYLLYYMLLSVDVIKMYQRKITRMPTERYRQLAFMIDCFYKENGYINVSDLISYLSDDKDCINTIGEIMQLELPDEVDKDKISDYLENIRKYNEKVTISMYKNKMNNVSDYKEKLEYAKKALELKKRSEEDNE